MRCPGQDSQYWTSDAIYEVPCPKCGAPVEFFKDDSARICPACRTRFANPKLDFGCAAYCPYAAQCVGAQEGREQENSLKEILIEVVKGRLGDDVQLWRHLRLLAESAEMLARSEGTSLFNVLILCYLHSLDDILVSEILAKLEKQEINVSGLYHLVKEQNLQRIEWQIIEDAKKIVSFANINREKKEKELKNLAGLCHTESGRTFFLRHDED